MNAIIQKYFYALISIVLFITTFTMSAQGPYDDAIPAPAKKDISKAEKDLKLEFLEEFKKTASKTDPYTEGGDALKALLDNEEDGARRFVLYTQAERSYILGSAFPEAYAIMKESEQRFKDPGILKRKQFFLEKIAGFKKGNSTENFKLVNQLLFDTMVQRDWSNAEKLFKTAGKFATANKNLPEHKEFAEMLLTLNYLKRNSAGHKEQKVIELEEGVVMRFNKIPKGILGYHMLWNDGMGGQVPRFFVFNITREFYMAQYELTQEQFKSLTGEMTQSVRLNSNLAAPAGNISWRRSQEICDILNARFGEHLPPGYTFRLPTIAEWHLAHDEEEYSNGTPARLYTGKFPPSGEETFRYHEIGWTETNAQNTLWDVGQKIPNKYGLYDTHGNVLELNYDYGSPGYHPNAQTPDPIGHLDGLDSYALTYTSPTITMDQRLNPRPVMIVVNDTRSVFSDSEISTIQHGGSFERLSFDYKIENSPNCATYGMRVAIAPILPYERNIREIMTPDSINSGYVQPVRPRRPDAPEPSKNPKNKSGKTKEKATKSKEAIPPNNRKTPKK